MRIQLLAEAAVNGLKKYEKSLNLRTVSFRLLCCQIYSYQVFQGQPPNMEVHKLLYTDK